MNAGRHKTISKVLCGIKQDKCSGWDTENPGFIYWDICIKILVVAARTGGKHAAETETCQNYFYE